MLAEGDPTAGNDLIREAAIALREKAQLEESDLTLLSYTDAVTMSLWDFDNWEALTWRTLQLARDSGSFLTLPRVLGHWAEVKGAEGDFPAAASALAEAETIAEATGAGHDWHRESSWLAAWRYPEAEALAQLDMQERKATSLHPLVDCARAIVHNAAGRYESALQAVQRSFDTHPLGILNWSLPELIEAAPRCGQHERAKVALRHLVKRTRMTSTEWGLGLEARSTALLTDDRAVAESLYREAIARLGRARTRPDLARAHLLYGEWLRRENRRVDAREQLRTAHDMFASMGAPGFAERARRELAATGETPRKRTDDRRDELTPQESQVARLAREGLSNPEIGARLFISPKTVEYHLHKVFTKLEIRSRTELGGALERVRSVAEA